VPGAARTLPPVGVPARVCSNVVNVLPIRVVLAEERRQGFVLLSQARRYLLELRKLRQQFRELGRCGEQLRVQVAGLVELDIEGMGIALLEA